MNEKLKNHIILIEDPNHSIPQPPENTLIIYWSKLDCQNHELSLIQKMYDYAEEFKANLLDWSYSFSQQKINHHTVFDTLKNNDGFSFWWMTSLSEMSPLRSETYFKIFKILTLEKIFNKNQINRMTFIGQSKDLKKILQNFCKKNKATFIFKNKKFQNLTPKQNQLRTLFNKLPHPIKALAFWTRKLIQWKKSKPHIPLAQSTDQSLNFVTYFPNVDLQKIKNGDFFSKYWGNLHDLLDKSSYHVNWIWIFATSPQCNYQEAIQYKKLCNLKHKEKYSYFLLEDFLHFKSFFNAIYSFLKLIPKTYKIFSLNKFFTITNSQMNFFEFFKSDIKDSFLGINAMASLFFIESFKNLSKKLQQSQKIFYIWENQSWELSLIYYWKMQNPSIPIIGSQHATVRPLDLRSFFSKKEYNSPETPLPDTLAVNGMGSYETMTKGNYPKVKLKKVEALRYTHLEHLKTKDKNIDKKNLLVITGYLKTEASFQINLLKKVIRQGGLSGYKKIIFKPHPFLAIDSLVKDFPFNYEIEKDSIIKALKKSDIVYCDNTTSAIIEAMHFQLPIIVLQAVNNISQNPFIESNEFHFVYDVDSLKAQLLQPKHIQIDKDFLITNSQLELWKSLF